jgi:hypothetical protein
VMWLSIGRCERRRQETRESPSMGVRSTTGVEVGNWLPPTKARQSRRQRLDTRHAIVAGDEAAHE